ncbi:MAG: hypothetical protein GT601_17185 [Acidaminobacter sp.]|uniref:MBL fold metallo-hydrolase n=1 Tax=Acidaminobacter sp. TaxID=1872102 RepID=UPI00138181E8|nr:MBL fold metallo-hydrolase [Acidaminobacter sp.]MZQ99402.1 hypothetical protein [Acidaminobacter sp.]
MSESYEKIVNCKLNNREIAILWLGQAGFLIKSSDGIIIAIDPYLSDCGERIKGFVRQSQKSVSAEDLKPNLYITTHLHFDHFDYDAIPIVAKQSNAIFLGPESCCLKLLEIGLDSTRIIPLHLDKEIEYKSVKIKSVFADHGTLSPDAVGILMRINGTVLYFSGDTAYRPEKLTWLAESTPDLSFLSINGNFGNLNAAEGACLASDLKTKIAIPCHYGTFIEHGGDPLNFQAEMGIIAPACQVIIMNQEDLLIYKPTQVGS